MARQKGSANFAGTLEVLAGGPLDARTRVPAKADLTASGQFPYPYVGLECYVIAENKKYRLIAYDPTDPDNWEEMDSNTKANSSSFAPVETSTTSEHAYEVGDHLMLAGQRYIVTANIAVGDALDVSTNIQAISFEDETGLSQADFADIITPLPGKFMGGINFSTEEQVVGTWIDGKPLYQKTVSCGALPNNTTKDVNHGIANIDQYVSVFGIFWDTSGTGESAMMPFGTPGNDNVGVWTKNKLTIVLHTGSNRTAQSACVTLQYTKSTY